MCRAGSVCDALSLDPTLPSRIQHLLSLSNPTGPEVTYFHKDPPAKALVRQKHPQKRYPNRGTGSLSMSVSSFHFIKGLPNYYRNNLQIICT